MDPIFSDVGHEVFVTGDGNRFFFTSKGHFYKVPALSAEREAGAEYFSVSREISIAGKDYLVVSEDWSKAGSSPHGESRARTTLIRREDQKRFFLGSDFFANLGMRRVEMTGKGLQIDQRVFPVELEYKEPQRPPADYLPSGDAHEGQSGAAPTGVRGDAEKPTSARVVSTAGNPGDAEAPLPAATPKNDYDGGFNGPKSIKNAQYRRHLEWLEGAVKERVIGQDAAVGLAVEAVRAKAALPNSPKPAVMLFLGTTGTGKTELAEALAIDHFGSRDRLHTFSLGAVKSLADLNSIFGSPKGFTGSDTAGPFEQFLKDHPDGGVLLFDEVGNAGGGKGQGLVEGASGKGDKEAILKAFYDILDKGEWTSPSTGETYKLNQYIFAFTSNEGQELFSGLSSDAERLAMWERSKSKDVLNRVLKDHSWPEAFIPRFRGNIILFKPLSLSDRTEIARKLVEGASKELGKEHGLAPLKYDPSLLNTMADTFFSHEEGVRSMAAVTQDSIPSLISRTVEAAYKKGVDPSRLTLRLSLKDNYAEVRAKRESERRVPLKLEVDGLGDETVTFERELSALAPVHPASRAGTALSIKNGESRAELSGLRERLRSHVIGQDEAVDVAVEAIRAKAALPNNPKPMSMLMLGTTGTGKTELAKAIALELYGGADKLETFDMGTIKDTSQLNSIFGAPTGYVGSDKEPPFERFLKKNPSGGVVLFDEIGNVGGKNASHAEKEAILKTFYRILDEGAWTSPSSGKTYSLKNFTFAFSSNEGQELFQRLPSDDLRLATWEKNKSVDSLTELLKKHGWPEALIPRFQDNIVLFRPLSKDNRIEVARKMIRRSIGDFIKEHRIGNIEYPEEFLSTLADSFFSHARGGRAMEAITGKTVPSMIGQLIHTMYESNDDLSKATLRLELSDNYEGKFRFAGQNPPDRKVELRVIAQREEKPDLVLSQDITSRSPEKTLANRAELYSTAIHEAGHVVGNDPRLTGERLDMVTVRGQGGYLGYARYRPTPGASRSVTREGAIAQIGKILAGGIAEELLSSRRGASSGRSGDLGEARRLAQVYVTTYGLSDRTLDLPVKDGKVLVEREETQEAIRKLVHEGDDWARKRLSEKWTHVQSLASELMKRESLNGDQYAELLRRVDGELASGKRAKLIPLSIRGSGDCERGYSGIRR